jgi:aminotransferase
MKKYVSNRMDSLPMSSIRVIFEKARRMKDVIRLEIGEPNFDTPINIKEAAKKALDENFTHYTAFSGCEDLREVIAEKVKSENGIEADPQKEVIVTPGACSSIYCSILATVNPGEEVLVPDPGWPHYEPCIRLAGGIPVHYRQLEKNDFRADPNELAKKVTKKTKAIILNSPNNPTGSVLNRMDLEGIAQVAEDNDMLVISDEVYEKILYDNAEHISIASLDGMQKRAITINSFSKTYSMTGWRVGYTVAREEIIAQMHKIILYTSTCANSIAQRAAIAATVGPQNAVSEMVREYKQRRDYVVKRLNEIKGISCQLPKGTFYVFPNVKRLMMSSIECTEFLLEQARVATVPGSGFGEYGEGYLRLSTANSLENLEKAMDRIEKSLIKKAT